MHDDHVALARVRDDFPQPGPVGRRAGLLINVDPIARDPDLLERVDLPIEVLLHRRHPRIPKIHLIDRTGGPGRAGETARRFGTNFWDGRPPVTTEQADELGGAFHFQGNGPLVGDPASLQLSAQLRSGRRCEQRPALEFLEVSAPIGWREVAHLCFRRNALYGLICHGDGLPDDNADCAAGATSTPPWSRTAAATPHGPTRDRRSLEDTAIKRRAPELVLAAWALPERVDDRGSFGVSGLVGLR